MLPAWAWYVACSLEERPAARVELGVVARPAELEAAQLWYQSIGYRWARNLNGYKAAEPRRFALYYDQVAPASALVLTRATRTVD